MTSSNFKLHEFSSRCGESEIFYQILHMEGSAYVWIGNEEAKLDNLVVAMQPGRVGSDVCTSNLIGSDSSDYNGVASRVSRRIHKHLILSANLSDDSAQIRRHVEDMLIEYLSV